MEKRKFTRFRTQENAFAAIRGNFTKIGKITDISVDGLAFRYLTRDKSEEQFSRVDIFLVENGFYLHNIPCRIVYEIPEDAPDKGFLVQKFRCGLQFGERTKNQSEQLELFIEKYTTGILDA